MVCLPTEGRSLSSALSPPLPPDISDRADLETRRTHYRSGGKTMSLRRLKKRLSAYLPARGPTDGDGLSTYRSDLDQEAARLLSRDREQCHVWVQGQLVQVTSSAHSSTHVGKAGQHGGGPIVRERMYTFARRQQEGNLNSGDAPEEGPRGRHQHETSPRGYGIGGAGNIREQSAFPGENETDELAGRPTDIMGSPYRGSSSAASSLRPRIFG